MRNYRISVIMGIYNCASTLPEAIDSLLAQTYQEFILIMCDDGSRDNTYAVAKHYADTCENIVLIRNERNKGLNYTLNRCLALADTEYVARMDGDDISEPERFAKEISLLDKHPEYAFLSTGMSYFDSHGVFRVDHPIAQPQPLDFVRCAPFKHAPCMVRRDVFLKVKGYTEDKRLLRVEDYHLWFKMYAAGYRGYNIKEPLYRMRDDRSAFSRRTFLSRLNEAYVKYVGYKMLHLPFYYYLFCLEPLLKGLVPYMIYRKIHVGRPIITE